MHSINPIIGMGIGKQTCFLLTKFVDFFSLSFITTNDKLTLAKTSKIMVLVILARDTKGSVREKTTTIIYTNVADIRGIRVFE